MAEQEKKLTLISNNQEEIERNYDKKEVIDFFVKDHKELAKLLGINEFTVLKMQWATYEHIFFCEHHKEIMKEFGEKIQNKLLVENKK